MHEYVSSIRACFVNCICELGVQLFFGTTHLSVGFNDLGLLLRCEFMENDGVMGTSSAVDCSVLTFVGIDRCAFAVARSLVMAHLLSDQHVDTNIVVQVWFSATWTADVFPVFRRSTRAVLGRLEKEDSSSSMTTSALRSSPEEHKKVLNYLKFWSRLDGAPSLTAARQHWYEANIQLDPVRHTWHTASLTRLCDRMSYIDYIFTGDFHAPRETPTCGSALMWCVPPNAPILEHGTSVLNVVLTEELLAEMRRSGGTDREVPLLELTHRIVAKQVWALQQRFHAGRIHVRLFCCKVARTTMNSSGGCVLDSARNASLYSQLKALRARTATWSNLCDYIRPTEFHHMAAACSFRQTQHFGYSINWMQETYGVNLLDYPQKRDREGILKEYESPDGDFAKEMRAKGIDRLFVIPPYTSIHNLTEAFFARKFRKYWVNHFAERGSAHGMEAQAVRDRDFSILHEQTEAIFTVQWRYSQAENFVDPETLSRTVAAQNLPDSIVFPNFLDPSEGRANPDLVPEAGSPFEKRWQAGAEQRTNRKWIERSASGEGFGDVLLSPSARFLQRRTHFLDNEQLIMSLLPNVPNIFSFPIEFSAVVQQWRDAIGGGQKRSFPKPDIVFHDEEQMGEALCEALKARLSVADEIAAKKSSIPDISMPMALSQKSCSARVGWRLSASEEEQCRARRRKHCPNAGRCYEAPSPKDALQTALTWERIKAEHIARLNKHYRFDPQSRFLVLDGRLNATALNHWFKHELFEDSSDVDATVLGRRSPKIAWPVRARLRCSELDFQDDRHSTKLDRVLSVLLDKSIDPEIASGTDMLDGLEANMRAIYQPVLTVDVCGEGEQVPFRRCRRMIAQVKEGTDVESAQIEFFFYRAIELEAVDPTNILGRRFLDCRSLPFPTKPYRVVDESPFVILEMIFDISATGSLFVSVQNITNYIELNKWNHEPMRVRIAPEELTSPQGRISHLHCVRRLLPARVLTRGYYRVPMDSSAKFARLVNGNIPRHSESDAALVTQCLRPALERSIGLGFRSEPCGSVDRNTDILGSDVDVHYRTDQPVTEAKYNDFIHELKHEIWLRDLGDVLSVTPKEFCVSVGEKGREEDCSRDIVFLDRDFGKDLGIVELPQLRETSDRTLANDMLLRYFCRNEHAQHVVRLIKYKLTLEEGGGIPKEIRIPGLYVEHIVKHVADQLQRQRMNDPDWTEMRRTYEAFKQQEEMGLVAEGFRSRAGSAEYVSFSVSSTSPAPSDGEEQDAGEKNSTVPYPGCAELYAAVVQEFRTGHTDSAILGMMIVDAETHDTKYPSREAIAETTRKQLDVCQAYFSDDEKAFTVHFGINYQRLDQLPTYPLLGSEDDYSY